MRRRLDNRVSAKRIYAPDAAVILAMGEVFGDEFGSAGGAGGSQDKRIPKAELPALLLIESGK